MRTLKASLILFLILSVLPFYSYGQENTSKISITDALVLKRPGFRRAAFRSDPVEAAIVAGTWKTPSVGDAVAFGDTSIQWEAVTADENGWFGGRGMRGAYVCATINSDQDKVMLLDENGNDFLYINGDMRVGNRYGSKDTYESWEPNFNFSIIPVELKKGNNEFLFYTTRAGRLKTTLYALEQPVSFNLKDPTIPDFLVGEEIDTWGAVIIMNGSPTALKNLTIESKIAENQTVQTRVPVIPGMTVRKIGFMMKGSAPNQSGDISVSLKLFDSDNKPVTSSTIQLKIKETNDTHKRTFVSDIDGSVQYYAVNPAQKNPDQPKALVLSVHGASVEAINQANSYYGKTWAHIVAPTNRRPYGFNWEDWGRLDALEVLNIAKHTLSINPDRIYLTGHSMGGHGAWHLGGTFPDQFAAIGPSAGWISFWSYRVRDNEEEQTPLQEMLMRATSPSHTMAIAENYKQEGVYIIHGSDDDNVRVDQARQMVEHLQKFHKDFIYHEEPGQGHWWDVSDEPGSDCVDWAPLFDFFARHARPGKGRIRDIEFITASPGISSENNWLAIEAQQKQLDFSKVNIRFDPGKRRFVGTTENVERLSFDLSIIDGNEPLLFDLDGQKLENVPIPDKSERIWLEKQKGSWKTAVQPSPSVKGPRRYGTFKDAFKNRFMFVYGTKGTAEENAWALAKAKYDAEYFWYQGNGSIDIIPDTEFDSTKETDRNIILYGNAETNRAWKSLLKDCPVQVSDGKIKIGNKTVKGKDLGCFMIRPRPGSDVASVGVIAGTGITGMRSTDRRPYLSPGYSYPDVTIFNPEVISEPEKGVKFAGFFGLDWKLDSGEFVWNTESK
jgi:predicted peptidase